MPYTVWCDDRLVGESALDYIANTDDHWMGDFVATPFGEEIIPIMMAPRVAMLAREDDARIQEAQRRRDELALELRGPDGVLIPTQLIEITDTRWLLEISESRGWGLDSDDSELRDELEVSDDGGFERIDADPPPWLDEEDDELDEFDVPDVEFEGGSVEPPPDFPRYQLQVLFPGFLTTSPG